MPWARGSSLLKLMVQVDLRTYCFQASLPDSLPPPVCFSPPKAPPISAPLVGMFTLTRPQSEPLGPIHLWMAVMSLVKRLLDRPCFTSLFHAMPSSTLLHLST